MSLTIEHNHPGHGYFDRYRKHENRVAPTGPVPKKTHPNHRVGFSGGDLTFDPPYQFSNVPTAVDNYTGNPDHLDLGNNLVGDCVCACMGHAVNQLEWQAGLAQTAFDANCLQFYAGISGYVIGQPETDSGSLISDGLTAMCVGGLGGVKFLDHIPISPLTNVFQLQWSISNFLGAHGGLQLPVSAMDQINAGEPWTVVGGPIDTGHATYFVGYDPEWFYVNTWGFIQKVSYEFVDFYYEEMHTSVAELMLLAHNLQPAVPDILDNNWEYVTGSPAQPFERLPFVMVP